MKTLGTEQLLAMKFERLPLSERFFKTLGRLPQCFMIIVYGDSGEGKTEFCVQLAKELTKFGKVKWMGYETAHDADIQDAAGRNDFKGLPISWVDPWEIKERKKKPVLDFPRCKDENINRLFEDFVCEILGKKSARYWFIDSIDGSKFTEEMIMWLRPKIRKTKGLICIAHAKGRAPKKEVSKAVEFYGHIGIYVKSYIAYVEKNRFGGFEPYVVYEKKARELNPLFFGLGGKDAPAKAKKKPPARKRKKATDTE